MEGRLHKTPKGWGSEGFRVGEHVDVWESGTPGEGREALPAPHLALRASPIGLFLSSILLQSTGDLASKCFSEFCEAL